VISDLGEYVKPIVLFLALWFSSCCLWADEGDEAWLQMTEPHDNVSTPYSRSDFSTQIVDSEDDWVEYDNKKMDFIPTEIEMNTVEKTYGVGLEGKDEHYLNELDGSSLNDEVIWTREIEYEPQPFSQGAEEYWEALKRPFVVFEQDTSNDYDIVPINIETRSNNNDAIVDILQTPEPFNHYVDELSNQGLIIAD